MAKHKVLVFGGRDYTDAVMVDRALSQFWKVHGQFAIIEGGARGADRLGRQWGRSKGLCVITVDADWDSYRKGAGHVRNAWMMMYCEPTYGIGFPGGSGTADMRALLENAKVPLWLPAS